MGACASRPADAEVEALEGQLAAARAAVRHAERQAAEAEQRAKQHESKALSLELERRRLAGQVAELQRRLKQAGGQRELPQDGAAANGMPAAAAATAARQPTLPSDAAAPELEAGLAAENERLRSELGELRAQMEAVLRENGELAERLMQVAFEQPPPPLDTPYKVERRSSKHERSSATTGAAAAAAAAAAAGGEGEQHGGAVDRRGSGRRWLGSP